MGCLSQGPGGPHPLIAPALAADVPRGGRLGRRLLCYWSCGRSSSCWLGPWRARNRRTEEFSFQVRTPVQPREGSTGKRGCSRTTPSSLHWTQQPEPIPAGRGSALRGRSSLLSGEASGLLQRQGMAQPVLLLLLRSRSWLGRPAGFGRGICTLRQWLCPGRGGGQPSWGRAGAWSRRLSLGMGHGGCGECGASPERFSGGRGRKQVLIFVLEAQPVGPSLPGGDGAACRWGGLLGAWFSLVVYVIICKEPTSRQRGEGLGQGKQPVPRVPTGLPL